MAELILNAEVRNKVGKEDAKKLRVKRMVPTVVYGKDVTPVHCALPKDQVEKIIRKANRNALYTLKLSNNESRMVLVRDFQKHPLNHEYIHIDLQAVHADKPVRVNVEIDFVGQPIGKKVGGIFTALCKLVKVECLPEKIPEVIKLNIDNVESGASLHVSDIQGGDYKIITSPKIALCQVSKVKDEAEATAEGEAPAAAAAAPAKKAK